MKERTESLKKTLAERGENEAANIRLILDELQVSIHKQLSDPKLLQEFLPTLAPDEREQFDRNADALLRRVTEIPAEIERETAAIAARFANPDPRMFPVAVTFLIPEKMATK